MRNGDRVAIPLSMLSLLDEPLAIQLSVFRLFETWVAEGSVPITALVAVDGVPVREAAAPQLARVTPANAAALIPVHGPITRRPTALAGMCGGTSTEQLSAQLAEAMADPNISRVVMEFDTPGGTVDGVPELAAEIRAARERKPITALVDSVAGSAGYWLASQASEIVVAPSAQVGSIGVFGRHVDQSEADKKAGLKVTYVYAGKHKVEGNPHEPLSDDAREHFQKGVDALLGDFHRDVAAGRNVPIDRVATAWGQGRMVRASEAVALGMADRVGTLSTIGLTRASGADTRRAAARQRERAALELNLA